MHHIHSWFWIGLLLVSCDKSEDSGSPTGSNQGPAKLTRHARPPRADLTELQNQLQTDLSEAEAVKSPEEREKAIAQIAWNAIETHPELALEAFRLLATNSPEKIRLIQHFAMRLAEKNPDEALAWAATLDSEEQISTATARIALVLSATDPHRAADLLSESGLAGRDFDVAVVQVLQRWSAASPPDAAAWVVMFPPGNSREAGITTVVSQWAKTDVSAIFSWMAKTQDTAVRREIAFGIQMALLQQPQTVREEWLKHADPGILQEIEQQKDRAVKEGGDVDPQPQP